MRPVTSSLSGTDSSKWKCGVTDIQGEVLCGKASALLLQNAVLTNSQSHNSHYWHL
jgi:hypothetical protein